MKLSSLEAIASALRDANVRYLIVGGLAVAAHGHGRATFDIDLVVQLQPENVKRAVSALEAEGYRPTVPVAAADFANAERRESWIRDKGMVVFQPADPLCVTRNTHPDERNSRSREGSRGRATAPASAGGRSQ